LRILHVYKDVYPPVAGGIERHIDSIRRALPDLRHDVLVCGRQVRTRTRRPTGGTGIEILVGEFGRVLSTPLAPTFPYWFAKHARGAVVHLHMPQPVGELSALLMRGVAPLVATYHADIYRQRALLFVYRPLVTSLLRSADVVITGSRAMKHRSPLIRGAGVEPCVVPYGIDHTAFSDERIDAAQVAELRERYGQEHIVSVGRLVPYKGFDRLVAAASALPCPVVIVGDGISRPALQSQIDSLGLQGRVHLVGQVSDDRLAAHLAAASVFVLPSWNRAEAFGIALLEAQAAGTPVVATDVGTGTEEALVPGETGLMVPPSDTPALVQAISSLLSDRGRRAEMAEAGRCFVRDKHSLQSMAAGLRPIYESLAPRP
jgi:rhamnosyl/mannosyltransferase